MPRKKVHLNNRDLLRAETATHTAQRINRRRLQLRKLIVGTWFYGTLNAQERLWLEIRPTATVAKSIREGHDQALVEIAEAFIKFLRVEIRAAREYGIQLALSEDQERALAGAAVDSPDWTTRMASCRLLHEAAAGFMLEVESRRQAAWTAIDTLDLQERLSPESLALLSASETRLPADRPDPQDRRRIFQVLQRAELVVVDERLRREVLQRQAEGRLELQVDRLSPLLRPAGRNASQEWLAKRAQVYQRWLSEAETPKSE